MSKLLTENLPTLWKYNTKPFELHEDLYIVPFSKKKAVPRFELGVKDLQSSALPLGHTAEPRVPGHSPKKEFEEFRGRTPTCP
jgi:hypothetical protein